jgi:hypothetical protein
VAGKQKDAPLNFETTRQFVSLLWLGLSGWLISTHRPAHFLSFSDPLLFAIEHVFRRRLEFLRFRDVERFFDGRLLRFGQRLCSGSLTPLSVILN